VKKIHWIVILMVPITVFLSRAIAAPPPPDEAATARGFCIALLAGEDDKTVPLMGAAVLDALGETGSQDIRDTLAATLGQVESVGAAWFVDEIQGYRRYRVPVSFSGGERDMLVAFEPGGKVGGLFTVARLERPGPAKPVAVSDAAAAGKWGGTLAIPSQALDITVELVAQESGWSGTIDIPAQGLLGHPLEKIAVAGSEVRFRMAGIPGEPTFKGTRDGDSIAGTMTQSGAAIPFTLERGHAVSLARPQTPEPPFDYASEEVTYASGKLTVAGTLTKPKGAGPFPAVLLISGSGAQDRDEQILGHRPFLVLADHLTKAGIAVLRTDDRGVGGSGGNLNDTTGSDLAEDALAGVRFLASRSEIDARRIGLVGHSEGGTVAPLAASRSDDVAFIVLLAGTGVPGDELMELQMQLHMRALGVNEAAIDASAAESRKLHRLIAEGATIAAITEQLAALKRAQGDPSPVTPQEAGQMTTTWLKYFLTYDPRPTLARVHVPVLALNGELDLQVDAAQNLDSIRDGLRHNPNATVRRLPGLNHLFQTAKTGAFSEYATIEETIAPAVLDLVRDWILARVPVN
jgi:pimeloyl-ACP methyl ester carboxylesterase